MSESLSLVLPDEVDELRHAVRGLLASRAAWGDVLARTEAEGFGVGAWTGLVDELGVAALPLPEEFGGGASWNEAAVVAEELGRAVADVPFLTSAGIATALLQSIAATDDLAATAAGRIAAVVFPWTEPLDPDRASTVRVDGGVLRGRVPLVAGALEAQLLIVVADGRILAVDAVAADILPVPSLDMTRQLADVVFDGTPYRGLASGSDARTAVERAGSIGLALLASEQLGLAEAALDRAVDYVKVRHQFGRPIGSFQAIKHRLAELWTEVISARAVARYAAVCAADDDPDLPVAATLAKVVCSRVAQHAAEELIQLHGGIGFTWEHPAHLYLKRARADALALGAAAWHRDRLGHLVDL